MTKTSCVNYPDKHRGRAAVASIAAKIGCTAQTLQNWMNKA
jgi:hypothetical protein